MSKKNKKKQIAGSEKVNEDKVLSDAFGDAEEADENMDENIEEIVTEEESDTGTEAVVTEEENAEPVTEEIDTPEEAETSSEESTTESQECDPKPITECNNIGIVTRPVNFRKGPSFGKASIMELKMGTKVIVSDSVEGDKGTWYKCEFDGRTGYVKATGVSIAK